MARWKTDNKGRKRRERMRASGDQCIFCFAISWLYDHDHGREFELLVENLTDVLDGSGYEVWKAPADTVDTMLHQFGVDHDSANQRHVAIAIAAIERSWERGQPAT